ncbi:PREDICTED: uncharacterized protein LOC109471314 [Branchiostoma belcheri]|uniref:Uncharacterized protein LOC109471314 n=1 Tax=Branchiostoma belcheri TaxID=7741 RepID=A0A6P4Z503_BRABE|nr:PREDICTED: uncharacterized protein LOC109471314 [Branchiostoma belcheri]
MNRDYRHKIEAEFVGKKILEYLPTVLFSPVRDSAHDNIRLHRVSLSQQARLDPLSSFSQQGVVEPLHLVVLELGAAMSVTRSICPYALRHFEHIIPPPSVCVVMANNKHLRSSLSLYSYGGLWIASVCRALPMCLSGC